MPPVAGREGVVGHSGLGDAASGREAVGEGWSSTPAARSSTEPGILTDVAAASPCFDESRLSPEEPTARRRSAS